MSENCDLGSQENTLIRDVYRGKMHATKIHWELLKETVNSGRALQFVINIDSGHQKQLPVSNSQYAPQFNVFSSQRQFCNANPWSNFQAHSWPTNQIDKTGAYPGHQTTKTNALAKGKACNYCGLQNHFSRVCRKKIPCQKFNSTDPTEKETIQLTLSRKWTKTRNTNPTMLARMKLW